MKSVAVLVAAIATLVTVSAQMVGWIPRTEADDRVFGWMKVYNQGYLSRSKWFKVPGFSNQTQATVAVMLVKQGERLEIFLNKAKVFESDKAIPAGFLFNQLSMDHGGAFNANDRMFISNLTILKK
jgi:hypothetical protein